MEKKQLTLVVVSLLVVVLSVSVAYFTAQIIGDGKTIDVASANLQIIFNHTDGQIAGTDIEPGWTSTKTFTVKNSTKSEYKYNIVLKDLVNTFVTTGYLQYKITSTNSGYNMTEFKDVPKSDTATDTILAYNVKIPVGTTQTYTIEFKYSNDENVDQSKDMGKTLNGSLFITEGSVDPNQTLYAQLLKDKTERAGERTNFSTGLSEDNTKTLYTSTEDGTQVYYFAGNATDNWVKFGGFYWRIIRTNSDGGIRLLYHGTSHNDTMTIIAQLEFNSTYNDPMYVGYMYGTSGTLESNRTNTNNSTIKDKIDAWYEEILKTKYGKYLSTTAVYCNDREVADGYTYSATGNSFDYEPKLRLELSSNPTYECTNVNDKFTVDSSTGNGKLTYPIALMTADEVIFAGGTFYSSATPFYYYNSSKVPSIEIANPIWTMSPFDIVGKNSDVFTIDLGTGSGVLGYQSVSVNGWVRPVTSLKSCVKYASGDGTPEHHTLSLKVKLVVNLQRRKYT